MSNTIRPLSFSFFQLLRSCGNVSTVSVLDVLVSFSCYLSSPPCQIRIRIMFQFLSVVTDHYELITPCVTDVLVSFSCYGNFIISARRVSCFSFFQLLPPRKVSLLDILLVLVSFSCYTDVARFVQNVTAFQFLSVVTVTRAGICRSKCMFQFLSVVTISFLANVIATKVLVSFSCYLPASHTTHDPRPPFQFLSVVTRNSRASAQKSQQFQFLSVVTRVFPPFP